MLEQKQNNEQKAEQDSSASLLQNYLLCASEIFKDVPCYEEIYSVSNLGRIFSKANRIYLTPHQNKNNKIWSVKLCKDGKAKHFSCAKIVAIAWLENSNPKLYKYAIHKDGNLNDYTLENVMWGTSLQSVARKWQRHPELREKFKQNFETFVPPTQKMTKVMTQELLKYRQLGYSSRQLADIFPIKKSQVMNILKRHGCA